MTDLHLDNKIVDIHCERSMFTISVVTYLREILDFSKTYDNIYIPLTLDNCLIVKEGVIVNCSPPYEHEVLEHLSFQDMDIKGKKLDFISMDDYFELRKK